MADRKSAALLQRAGFDQVPSAHGKASRHAEAIRFKEWKEKTRCRMLMASFGGGFGLTHPNKSFSLLLSPRCPVESRRARKNLSEQCGCHRGGAVGVVANSRHFRNRRRPNGTVHEGVRQSRDDAVQRKLQSFHEGQEGPPLRILPIGGLGEIGMNCMLVGNYDRYIMIDAGLMFPDFDELGVQKVLPDTSFIRRWRDKIEALVITHGHEDHIGALPWVVPALDPKTPIFATGFTMQLIKSRMKEYNVPDGGRCHTFEVRDRFTAGPFEIEPIRVTHSIPDCCGLVLRCQDGLILHTGDWKIDESPIDGKVFDRTFLEQLSREGVTLLMSDSTNVLAPGRTTSEADVAKALMRRISSARGRVIATQFASNVHRLGSVKSAAEATGRKLVFIGVSLRTYLEAAWRDGQAPFDPSILVKPEDMGAYSPGDLLIVTTGSQAEPRAALNLASFGTSRALKLNKDDLILYSAKMIPGNETRVTRMMNRIAGLGPTIIQGRNENLHTSGHAYRDELEEVLRLVKPQHFLPVHGEFSFLKEHELLGKANGIRHTTVIKNGEMLGVSPLRNGRVLSSGFSQLGRENFKLMYNDGDRAFGTAAELCLHERMQIALEGMIVASVEVIRDPVRTQIGAAGEGCEQEVGLHGRVRITTRCMWTDGGRLVEHLRKAAIATLASSWKDSTLMQVERKIALSLRKAAQKYVNRRPEVIVIATDTPSSHSDYENPLVAMKSYPSMDTKLDDAERRTEGRASSNDNRELLDSTPVTPMKERTLPVELPRSGLEITPETALDALPLERTESVLQSSSPMSATGPATQVPSLTMAATDAQDVKPTERTAVQEQMLTKSTPESVDVLRPKGERTRNFRKRARKWTNEEVQRMINIRSRLAVEGRKGVALKSLWKTISQALADAGFERSPEQCCSMWGSLLKKHMSVKEMIKTEPMAGKRWVHFEAMENVTAQNSEEQSAENCGQAGNPVST